jgi:hypothetical protein
LSLAAVVVEILAVAEVVQVDSKPLHHFQLAVHLL